MHRAHVSLGDVIEDLITGYQGTCIAQTEWLNGCVRYVLQGKVGPDGKVPDPVTVDAEQVRVVSHRADLNPFPEEKTGGPQNDRAAQRR